MEDPLGPNAERVAEFFDGLERLTDGELLRLAASGDRSAEPRHRATYADIRQRVTAAGRQRAVEEGSSVLASWAGWREAVPVPGFLLTLDTLTSDARRQAWPALYDAMVGCIARDLLTDEEFLFLTDPVREVLPGLSLHPASGRQAAVRL